MNEGKLTDIKNKPEILSVVVNGDDGSVLLKWCTAVGADKYIIQRKGAQDEKFQKVGTVKSKITEFLDTTVPGEGVYEYRIVARKQVKDQDPITKKSKTESVSIRHLPPLNLDGVAFREGKGVDLTWKKQEDIDGYVVYRRYSFMKKPIDLATLEKDESTFCDDGIVRGQLYYYSIRSFLKSENGLNFSSHGEELPFILLDKPFLLSSKRRHRKKITFSFRLTAGADGYAVFKSASEDGEYVLTARTEGKFSLECTDVGAKKEKGAYYRFACFRNVDGKPVYSEKTAPIFLKYKF